ncbi:Acyl-CoA [Citrus sinensis]|nr:Acyl-CoA [Citrus sinensis]
MAAVAVVGRSPCRHSFGRQVQSSRICALFWGTKKSVQQQVLDSSLGDFTLTGSGSEGVAENDGGPKKICLSVISSISEVSANDWDTCALDATGPEKFNPFLTHGFLSSLEETGCAVKCYSSLQYDQSKHPEDSTFILVLSVNCFQETGWTPCHIVVKDECENVLDAYYGYGERYYPKFQCCVPFTPVTGPRILLRNTSIKDQVIDVIISAMKDLTAKSRVSSLHITFPSENEWHKLGEKGFLQRIGMQYHWRNRNYKNFDEFLMDMKQNKRKNIRQERKKISAQNLTMKRLRGHEIKAKHWDSFYRFYKNTTDNKWGSPYLTRDFFHDMGSKMKDQVLLVVAEDGDELVAGALNLIGGDSLFGRLWGCHPRAYYPSLHFEACYYQAIEAAIELSLSAVEAGAQGEHKIQRGYLPVTTYSCHYLLHENFRKPIENFLVRESTQVNLVMKLLHESGPFKDEILPLLFCLELCCSKTTREIIYFVSHLGWEMLLGSTTKFAKFSYALFGIMIEQLQNYSTPIPSVKVSVAFSRPSTERCSLLIEISKDLVK